MNIHIKIKTTIMKSSFIQRFSSAILSLFLIISVSLWFGCDASWRSHSPVRTKPWQVIFQNDSLGEYIGVFHGRYMFEVTVDSTIHEIYNVIKLNIGHHKDTTIYTISLATALSDLIQPGETVTYITDLRGQYICITFLDNQDFVMSPEDIEKIVHTPLWMQKRFDSIFFANAQEQEFIKTLVPLPATPTPTAPHVEPWVLKFVDGKLVAKEITILSDSPILPTT